MKATHTHGPWEARSRSASDGSLVVMDATFTEVCQVVPKAMRQYGQKDDTDQANAVLIASAPDLLAALDVITKWATAAQIGNSKRSKQWTMMEFARAAIARARGEA